VKRKQKWWRAVLALTAAGIVLQVSASLIVRTTTVRRFLTGRLESAFGREVEVREYSASLFPTPQLDATAISVSEDPAFGTEYFLRSDRLSAGFRWSSLLRGRFELGTLRLERPSLILVRNEEGRWNLERWLPAVNPTANSAASVVQKPAPPTHRLQKIEISDGRVNFKIGDEKIPFAFLRVEGDVEQVAQNRWRLDLESEPWRSGVPLQLAGTVRLSGDVAGTSARLQPAHLQMSWEQSSLADVFRLIGGRDFGVRGTFAGEATVDSGGAAAKDAGDAARGDWSFSVQARAAGIHRWDLTERNDNPRVGLRARGRWNPGLGVTTMQEVVVETPRSNLRGSGTLRSAAESQFELHFDSAGIQAADFLDWWRAFRPNVAEALRGSQYFTGTASFAGWPLKMDDAAFSSSGGRWTVPGLASSIVVRAVRGGTQRGKFVVDPFAVSLPVVEATKTANNTLTVKDAPPNASSTLNVSLTDDLQRRTGSFHLEGQLAQTESVFAVASAFGRNVQQGWELRGKANGDLRWEWAPDHVPGWTGHVDLTHAVLEAAGLNQPLQLDTVRTDWDKGRRKFTLTKVAAFSASWTGSVEQNGVTQTTEDGEIPVWNFQLQADHLDAGDLDRWIGPRARPSWLQRLLPSGLGGESSSPPPVFLKRIRATGDLEIDDLTVEKIKLKAFRASVNLAGSQLTVDDAQAQWSGGTAQGRLVTTLSASPVYEVSASFSRVAITQTPWLAHLADRLAGTAEGSLKLRASGIGRDALLGSLAGQGQLHLSKVELRGWDLPGTMAQGEWKTGISRWATGSGTFHINEGVFDVNALRLSSPAEEFLVKGSVSFSQDADLTAESHATGRAAHSPSSVRFLTISGPLSEPRVSLERAAVQQPGD
jgi:hypothetical protein